MQEVFLKWVNFLSSRNCLEITYKCKLNWALGWGKREREMERGWWGGAGGGRRAFESCIIRAGRTSFLKKSLFIGHSWAAPEGKWKHFSARGFPAWLLPTVESERILQGRAEAPRDWEWKRSSHCALLALGSEGSPQSVAKRQAQTLMGYSLPCPLWKLGQVT